MTATLLDWAALSADEVRTLLLTPDQQTSYGAELLTAALDVADDLSADLRLGGDVHWAGSARIHRDCSLTLVRELRWGVDLVRLYQTLTDPLSGLAARRNLGVFCLQTPDDVLGETFVDDDSDALAFAVTGQDRLYLMDRQVGRSYVVHAATNVLTALAQVFTDAGLSGVYIDGSASAATVPTDMAWPLIPGFGISYDKDGTGPTTWLDIANDLLKLIAYQPLWCDEDGFYRCQTQDDPATASPSFTFDATDTLRSPVMPNRTRRRDPWQQPNRWIFTRDNLPSGAPPVAGAGLYVVQNDDDGLSSVNARDGQVWPTQITITAADQATLVKLGDQRVAADKRAAATYTVTTSLYPCAGHLDVFCYVETTFGTAKVQATEWRIPLDGGPVEWSFADMGTI